VKAAVASCGPPRYVRAATGSRSGSASRSDSLIEFVKTNVAILPLLILTATTNSDELSYGLNDTAVDGLLDRLELGVDRRGAVG
jgi:hypothetical protein